MAEKLLPGREDVSLGGNKPANAGVLRNLHHYWVISVLKG